MTATITESVSGSTQGGVGRVARVIGPVVDVEFPANQIPDIYNALTAELTIGGKTRTVTFEVEGQEYTATADDAAYAVAAGAYDIVMAVGVEKLKDSGYSGLLRQDPPGDGTAPGTDPASTPVGGVDDEVELFGPWPDGTPDPIPAPVLPNVRLRPRG